MNRPGFVCLLAVSLLACDCAASRADFTFGGVEPSLEYLVDASNVVVAKVVEVQGRRHKYRVTRVLKRSKALAVDVGNVMAFEVSRRWPPADHWQPGEKIVAFLGDRTSEVRKVVNLTRPEIEIGDKQTHYLAVDKHGKVVLDPGEFLRRVDRRIERGAKADDGFFAICEDHFDYYAQGNELDSGEQYYDIRVPPDDCFRPMLEVTTRRFSPYDGHVNGIWAQAVLYNYYSSHTPAETAEHRRRAVAEMIDVARSLHARGQPFFGYRNYLTYPAYWGGMVSPGGRYLALSTGSRMELRDLRDGKVLYAADDGYAGKYHDRAMAFGKGDRHFAHLHADGRVTVFDLAKGKVAWRSKFAAAPKPTMNLRLLTFSLDGRFLALLMQGATDRSGSVLQAWNTGTGKVLVHPSRDWETNYRIDGFSHDSRLLKVRRGRDEWLVWDLESGRLATAMPDGLWQVPRFPGDSHPLSGGRFGPVGKIAMSDDGKLVAKVIEGKPARLEIQELESGKTVRAIEVQGLGAGLDLFFSAGGDALFLVHDRWCAWYVDTRQEVSRPAWIYCRD